MHGITSNPSYKTEIIAGSGNELRNSVPFPSTQRDATTAALGNILGLTADQRLVRNVTQDVYLTERVGCPQAQPTQ